MRSFLIVALLFAATLPSLAVAPKATPVPDFGVASSLSPIGLYEILLETPFPAELLPAGVATLRPYEWRDSNDPDLAGSIGAVIYADEDPFGARPPTAITFMIFPDATGPLAPMALVTRYGDPAEVLSDGQALHAGRADLGGSIGVFIPVDNVLVYGMAPTGERADEAAAALTEAGVTHLVQLANGAEAHATPVSEPSQSSETAFLSMAAAPFPADTIPFDTGEIVVLPMSVTKSESAAGLLGALLVRDADRTYRYPLATYQFYRDESAARDVISSSVRGNVKVGESPLPPEITIPYPTQIIQRRNGTTTVLVQVGAAIVTVDATTGDREEQRATALALAQIAVDHLVEITGLTD